MAIVTTKELARLAQVSESRIRQWVGEGMPRIKRNEYDSEASLRWIVERRQDSVALHSGESLTAARLKLTEERYIGQKQKNEREAGITITVEHVITAMRQRDAQMLQAIHEWVHQATSSDELALRRALGDRLRTRCADTFATLASSLSGGGDMEASALSNSG